MCALIGRRPSRKNPNLCNFCFNHLPIGGVELEIGVVFADVRGATTLGEQISPTAFADRLNEFYRAATDVLVAHDAIVDKLIGDEVMAIFVPGIAGADFRTKTAHAAIALARTVSDLPVGVAANAGVAFVGNVGSGPVIDFTALGDAVNVTSRLQSYASRGEVVLSSELYALVAGEHPAARHERVEVRGREQPVDIEVVIV
jgi:adenylate cyclase